MEYKKFCIPVPCIFFLLNSLEFANALVGRNVREAQEGEFPNVVCILRHTGPHPRLQYDVRCTGTLITQSHILSSEHCFNNMGTDSLYVLAESVDLRRARPYYIAWWITHDLWATIMSRPLDRILNDIAILKLSSRVSEAIAPALISPDENNSLYGLNVSLAGWGKLEDDLHPHIMHKAHVTIISNSDCEQVIFRITGTHAPVHHRYMCTLAEPSSLVNSGDSGGPILYGNFIMGVNRGTCPRTFNLTDSRKANLHFNVNYYSEFIRYNMFV